MQAIMLHAAGAGAVALAQPPGRHGTKQKKVFPTAEPTPALLQAQLSRAKCEIESLRFLKTDNGKSIGVYITCAS
jgi:hypothetical protein